MSFNVVGPTSRGRPELMWKDVVNADLHKKHLNSRLHAPTHYEWNKEMN